MSSIECIVLDFDGTFTRVDEEAVPFVDAFRPVHNLESLEALAAALSGKERAEHDPHRWLAKTPAA